MACCDHDTKASAERPTLTGNRSVRALRAGWVFALAALSAWAGGAGDAPSWSVTALYAIAIVAAGHVFAAEAVEVLREKRKVGIELLLTLAIAGAAALGQWREAALVACLYAISEALEATPSSRRGSRSAG